MLEQESFIWKTDENIYLKGICLEMLLWTNFHEKKFQKLVATFFSYKNVSNNILYHNLSLIFIFQFWIWIWILHSFILSHNKKLIRSNLIFHCRLWIIKFMWTFKLSLFKLTIKTTYLSNSCGKTEKKTRLFFVYDFVFDFERETEIHVNFKSTLLTLRFVRETWGENVWRVLREPSEQLSNTA